MGHWQRRAVKQVGDDRLVVTGVGQQLPQGALCGPVDRRSQTGAPRQWQRPQPVVRPRASTQPQKQQLRLELRRGEGVDGGHKAGLVCGQAVD